MRDSLSPSLSSLSVSEPLSKNGPICTLPRPDGEKDLRPVVWDFGVNLFAATEATARVPAAAVARLRSAKRLSFSFAVPRPCPVPLCGLTFLFAPRLLFSVLCDSSSVFLSLVTLALFSSAIRANSAFLRFSRI